MHSPVRRPRRKIPSQKNTYRFVWVLFEVYYVLPMLRLCHLCTIILGNSSNIGLNCTNNVDGGCWLPYKEVNHWSCDVSLQWRCLNTPDTEPTMRDPHNSAWALRHAKSPWSWDKIIFHALLGWTMNPSVSWCFVSCLMSSLCFMPQQPSVLRTIILVSRFHAYCKQNLCFHGTTHSIYYDFYISGFSSNRDHYE